MYQPLQKMHFIFPPVYRAEPWPPRCEMLQKGWVSLGKKMCFAKFCSFVCGFFLLQENPELLEQKAEESLHTYPAATLFPRPGFWLPWRQDMELDGASVSTPEHCSPIYPL